MNLKEAMTRADQLRPNALPDAQKAAWIYELDGKIARMMEKEPPGKQFSSRRTAFNACALRQPIRIISYGNDRLLP